MNQINYTQRRQDLIAGLKRKGIMDDRVLEAMLKIPRHEFIDNLFFVDPYEDGPQTIGYGQTISQPYIVALMTESLSLTGEEKVLELGTGCGYQTAVLCELAKYVYSIERIEKLFKKSTNNLSKLGYNNYELKFADGTLGWVENAPYDAIIVTATAPDVPEPLKEQLAFGGRLVIPVGKASPQKLICITKTDKGFHTKYLCGVFFVPLIGQYAWDK